jgi:glycosyltransferase involved in cell wall biosynthesis
MALRTPVVSTSKGAEGLDIQNNENILLADSPDSFAEAVICLLKDMERAHSIANNAYELVRTEYDWRKVMPNFTRIIEQIIQPH